MPGINTLAVEVTHISTHGVWVLAHNSEYFLPYEHFPWFKKATVEQVHNVEFQSETHLHWKDLDVDLSLSMIEDPNKYSLVSKD